MLSKKSLMRRLAPAFFVTGAILTGLPAFTLAQSNPGFTLWSGVERKDQLNYYLDFGGQANGWDRYRLRIPANKLELGVAQIVITYPDYYKGKFDPKNVEVMVNRKSVPLQEVAWDKENRAIQIYLKEPIEAGKNVEVQLSNVKNPPSGGVFYFDCRILTPGDIPLPRYVGTWLLSIS